MAAVRAGRDARGAMNDLPIPGQPDFDLNTMKLAQPAPQAAAQGALPPGMTQFAPEPIAPEYHSMNIPPPSESETDAKLAKIMSPKVPAMPDMSATHPNPVPAPLPVLKPGSDPAVAPSAPAAPFVSPYLRGAPAIPSTGSGPGGGESSFENLQRNQQGSIANLVKAGVPIALAALLVRTLFGKGRGGAPAAELEQALGKAGSEVAPSAGKTATELPAYADDTIANVSDEQRMAATEGGPTVTQEGQDKVARQLDINSGKIKPQDYMEGEKPRPGTEGYKQWFKFRQSQSRNRAAQ
jgi:hypothetical protein